MEDLQKQLNDLANIIQSISDTLDNLQNSQSIPAEFEAAIRTRLVRPSMKLVSDITTTLTSTPGGVQVPMLPDGFISIENNRSIPFYNNKPS